MSDRPWPAPKLYYCGDPECIACQPWSSTVSDDADVGRDPDRGAGGDRAGEGAVAHLPVDLDSLPILRIPKTSTRVILFTCPSSGLLIEVER